MAKPTITQATYDDFVKDNIVEFSMTPDEAREETVKQLEAEGVSLVNIIKNLSINTETGKPFLNEAIEYIQKHISEKLTDREKLFQNLDMLEKECLKSLPHRVLAGKNGAHDALITLLENELPAAADNKPDLEFLEKCLKAINALTLIQPDLFDAEALAIVFRLLELKEEKILIATLQWLQRVCIMHEINRQNIMNAGIMKQLKPLVTKDNAEVIREVTAVMRFLVLDDDIRVEFGCAHEHARQIASEVIVELTQLLAEYEDKAVLSDIILTIGVLAVRQEFCTIIEEAGALNVVFDLMKNNLGAKRLNREALKLIRALAGNDTVKVHIVEQGAAPIIKAILETHMSNVNVASAALACVATLTLRFKDNSKAFFETGIAEHIVETIRMHPTNKIIQRNGAWAVRNMISRSRDQCETWLSYGVEDLLNEALKAHPSITHDIKAALRDLGCDVELKEEWTGSAEKKIDENQQ